MFTPYILNSNPRSLITYATQTGQVIPLSTSSIKLIGGDGQTSFYDGSIAQLGIDKGILLTTGDGTPPTTNTQTSFGLNLPELGNLNDPDFQTLANTAFPGNGGVTEANILEFSFLGKGSSGSSNPGGSIVFDIVFASDEYPEFASTNFIDIAGVFVNGENFAFLDEDKEIPLSITNQAVNKLQLLRNNSGSPVSGIPLESLPIEYDGVSRVVTVVAPLKDSSSGDLNTIKIGVADTGDEIYDSALFVSNLRINDIKGSLGKEVLAKLAGTSSSDTLTGSQFNDFIDGGAGDDIINPGPGNDFVDAGAGNDIISGSQGDNIIDGGSGTDKVVYLGTLSQFNVQGDGKFITVGDNTDTLKDVEFLEFDDTVVNTETIGSKFFGSQGDDFYEGKKGNDTMTGENGSDIISGNDGNDFLQGDDGADFLDGGNNDDTLIGGSNDDFLVGGNDNDFIDGGSENDFIDGGIGADILTGADGEDILRGRTGNDILTGGNGNDVLNGDSGNDTLTGGTNQDSFIFASASSFISSDLGVDLISDFSVGIDKIRLSQDTFTALDNNSDGGLLNFNFAIVTSDSLATSSSAEIVYNSSNGNLYYNQNNAATGFGSGDLFAIFNGPLDNLSAADFQVFNVEGVSVAT